MIPEWTGTIPANPPVRTARRSFTMPRQRALGGMIIDNVPAVIPGRVEPKEPPLIIPKPVLIEIKSEPIQRRRFTPPEGTAVYRPTRKD
jgi:hypothetical protein